MSRLASVEAQYAELQANAPDCAAENEAVGLAQAPARPPRPPAFLAGLRTGIKLKQKETIVTRRGRDGAWEKVVEKRGADGTFELQEATRTKAAAPSHLVEDAQEHTALAAKIFSAERGAWCPAAEHWEQQDQQAQQPVAFSVVQYNTWFADVCFDARAAALLAILAARRADAVLLQEVTPRLLEALKADAFVRATYLLSDSTATTLAPYGVLMLVAKRAVAACAFHLHKLPTKMARRFLRADLTLASSRGGGGGGGGGGGRELTLGTVHLESIRCNAATRVAQLEAIFQDHLPPQRPAIVTGDFNFDPGDDEQGALEAVPGGPVKDAWAELHGAAPTDAQSATIQDRVKRIDRVLWREGGGAAGSSDDGGGGGCCPSFAIAASGIERLGEDAIEGTEGIRPSDHYGLFCRFTFL